MPHLQLIEHTSITSKERQQRFFKIYTHKTPNIFLIFKFCTNNFLLKIKGTKGYSPQYCLARPKGVKSNLWMPWKGCGGWGCEGKRRGRSCHRRASWKKSMMHRQIKKIAREHPVFSSGDHAPPLPNYPHQTQSYQPLLLAPQPFKQPQDRKCAAHESYNMKMINDRRKTRSKANLQTHWLDFHSQIHSYWSPRIWQGTKIWPRNRCCKPCLCLWVSYGCIFETNR